MSSNVIEFVVKARDLTGGVVKGVTTQLRTITANVAGVARQMLSLKNMVLGLAGVGGLIGLGKSFITAADTTEKLKVQLRNLLGSGKDAETMFGRVKDMANALPFELDEITASTVRLSTAFGKNQDTLMEMAGAAANAAAIFGDKVGGISGAADQLSRAFAAGSGAADRFRDAGVNAMIGIQSGAGVAGEEFKKKFLAAFSATNGKFKDAAYAMASTWTGLMSMLSDDWFNFRNEVMEGGLFIYFKAIAKTIHEDMKSALDGTKGSAVEWSNTIIDGINSIFGGIGFLMDAFRGLQVVWAMLKVAWSALIFGIIKSIDWVIGNWQTAVNTIIGGINYIINKLTAIYPELKKSMQPIEEVDWLATTRDGLVKAETEMNNAVDALAKLAMAPMPSESMDHFVERIKANVQVIKDQMKLASEYLAMAPQQQEQSPEQMASASIEQGAKDTQNTSEYQKRLDAFQQYTQQKLAAMDEANASEQERLLMKLEADTLFQEEAYLRGYQSEEQYQQAITALKDSYNVQRLGMDMNAHKAGLAFAESIRKRDLQGMLDNGKAMFGESAKQFKAVFNMKKAFAKAQLLVALPTAVIESFENGGGYPWGLIPAGLMLLEGAAQLQNISKQSFSGQAHSGLTNVPREGTYLLDKGERVIQPQQNKDLTQFLNSGDANNFGDNQSSVVIERLEIHVLENATNYQSLMDMPDSEVQQLFADKLIPAVDALSDRGIRFRDFTTGEQR